MAGARRRQELTGNAREQKGAFMKRTHLVLILAAVAIGVPALGTAQAVGELLRLFRPEVLRQLNGDTVRLLNFLPEVNHQNKAIVGRLFASGGLGHAKRGKDGVHRLLVRVPPGGQFIWRPAIVVMGHPGPLELEFSNQDEFSHHQVLLPNNGGRVFMQIPQFERGVARIELDGPGLYWFGCPVANHAGRGMLGLILVRGEVPKEAKLDRPPQPRK